MGGKQWRKNFTKNKKNRIQNHNFFPTLYFKTILVINLFLFFKPTFYAKVFKNLINDKNLLLLNDEYGHINIII